MKKYKISELSALKQKYAKVDVDFKIVDESISGMSIMLNLNTLLFEVARQNMIEYLQVHPVITSVFQTKNAKVVTVEGNEADVEYHLDVRFKVKEENHDVKLKFFTTNCRIQIQHSGKRECKPYEHLDMNCPPKFLAEKVLKPFCDQAYDDLKDRETSFISHLREEINRLGKDGGKSKVGKQKATPKNNTREKCAATKCKHKNVVVTKKDGRFGKCAQCDRVEHFDCVNANAFLIETIQKGLTPYYCTDCLTNNPVLGLEVTMDVETSPAEEETRNIGEMDRIEVSEPAHDIGKIVEEIVDDIATEMNRVTEVIKCNECSFETNIGRQMETHVRIKHIDVIKYACDKCDYNSRTESNLEDHKKSHHQPSMNCEYCDFTTQTESQLKDHKVASHTNSQIFNCDQCQVRTNTKTDLDSHIKSTHPAQEENITCGLCLKKLKPGEELGVHIFTFHKK